MLTLAGADLMLDVAFSGVGYTAALYIGLIDGSGAAPSYGAADTMADHPGWTELQDYEGATRPPLSFDPADAGAKESAGVVITYDAACRVAGYFISTSPTKGGTSGILISAGSFTPFARQPYDFTNIRWSLGLTDPAR